ncbi:hypothetical protein BH11ARM2_BH11ARM2_15060 [soil metagenome]
MANTYYATFSDADNAERAIGALLDHGMRNEDISVIRSNAENTAVTTRVEPVNDVTYVATMEDTNTARHIVTSENHLDSQVDYSDPLVVREKTTTAVMPLDDVEDMAKHGITTTTAADAGAGAIKGTAWGVGLGAVAALATLLVPGVGWVVGGGALAAALGTAAATAGAGAATGAVVGFLKDQGLEEHVINEYSSAISAGGILLAVNLPSGSCSEMEGREVMDKYGASHLRNVVQPYLA